VGVAYVWVRFSSYRIILRIHLSAALMADSFIFVLGLSGAVMAAEIISYPR